MHDTTKASFGYYCMFQGDVTKLVMSYREPAAFSWMEPIQHDTTMLKGWDSFNMIQLCEGASNTLGDSQVHAQSYSSAWGQLCLCVHQVIIPWSVLDHTNDTSCAGYCIKNNLLCGFKTFEGLGYGKPLLTWKTSIFCCFRIV